MFETENGKQGQGRQAFPADDSDARAQARRALQDAYDWRDDEPRAASAATATATTTAKSGAGTHPAAAPPAEQDERSTRAAVRRSRRESVRSISRTVGV